MKSLAATAVLGAAIAVIAWPSTPAEAAPNGSYRESCRRVRDVGSGRNPVISAQCRDMRGNWRDTTLNYRGCNDVSNDNGRLICVGGRPGGPGGPGWGGGNPGGPGWGGGNPNPGGPGWGNGGGALPAGSWRQSCEPREWSRGVLTARCENGNRGREVTSLNLRSCPSGRAGNAYGRLVCE